MKNTKLPLVVMIAVVVITVGVVLAYPSVMNGVIENTYEQFNVTGWLSAQTAMGMMANSGAYLMKQIFIGAVGIICFLISLRWYVKTRKNVEVKE